MNRAEGVADPRREYFRLRAPTYVRGNWRGKPMHPKERAAIDRLPSGLRTALDVGSGPGLPLDLLSAHASPVVGVDFSAEMLDLRTHAHPCVVADGYALPLASASVDVVTMRMSVHYFQVPRLCVELARVLVAGGFLVVLSIVPYGAYDTVWFNERHELKGKPSVRTPSALRMAALFLPHFVVTASRSWVVRHTIDAAKDEQLAAHVVHAPERIRRMYRVDSAGDGVGYSVKWVALTFRRVPIG